MITNNLKTLICPYCSKEFVVPSENLQEIMNILCSVCKKIISCAWIDGKYVIMPTFAWKNNVPPISKELFEAILKTVPKGGTILELGSGTTTKLFSEQRNIVSIEHKKDFIGYHNKPENYIYAPILSNDGWYTFDVKKLPKKYDCLLVDGPDLDNRMNGFLKNRNIFSKNVPWFIDDIDYEPFAKDIKLLVLAEKFSGRKYTEFKSPVRSWGLLI